MMAAMPTTTEQTTRSRGETRRVAVTLLAKAFPGWIALIAALSLLSGVLPALFAALVARLAETLPIVVARSNNSRNISTLVAGLSLPFSAPSPASCCSRRLSPPPALSPRPISTGATTNTSWHKS